MTLAQIKVYYTKIKLLLFTVSTSLYDFVPMLLKWPVRNISMPAGNEKIIVFVGGFATPRISRIAKWLIKNPEYKAIFLCHKKGYFRTSINFNQ